MDFQSEFPKPFLLIIPVGTMNRKQFLHYSAKVITATFASTLIKPYYTQAMENITPNFQLPALGYAYSALEPFIDAATMEIHYSKHHQAYLDNLNNALLTTGYKNESIEQILKNISSYNRAVRNNAGGHYNHSLFWESLTPTRKTGAKTEIEIAIQREFSSLDNFKKVFAEAGIARFGSGWVWLIRTPDKKLKVISTPNQDNPLMEDAQDKGTPLIALDVWEHAYYLKYQNKRAAYIDAWWNVLNWNHADQLYTS
jgi:Fe-Mn family superoxide dismutase